MYFNDAGLIEETFGEFSTNTDLVQLSIGVQKELEIDGELTLEECYQFAKYDAVKIVLNCDNITYNPDGRVNDLKFSDVSSFIGGSTARIVVDFNDCLDGQESPMIRNVATINKVNPTTTSSSDKFYPVFLGEMLHNIGLDYNADDSGFMHINGLARYKNNRWATILVSAGEGGRLSDTCQLRFGKSGGPDSVVVKTGDIIYLSYTGDDDNDNVPNVVEKMQGILEIKESDSDKDELTDYEEIYGYLRGSKKYYSDPAKKDTDNDGIDDKSDPEPLIPQKSDVSNIEAIALLGIDKDTVLNKYPFGPYRYRLEDDPTNFCAAAAALRYAVKLDSVPLSCYLQVNNDPKMPMKRRQIAGSFDTSGIWYEMNSTSMYPHSNLLIGANTVKITVQPANGDIPKTWTLVFFTKFNFNTNQFTVRLADLPWQDIYADVSTLNLTTNDPRIQGYVLVYTDNTSALELPAISSSVLPLKGGNWRTNWTVKNVMESKDFTNIKIDVISALAGTTYQIVLVPFTKHIDNGITTYQFAEGAVKTISTKKIMLKPTFCYWNCIDEADGSGDAEINYGMKVYRKAINKPDTCILDIYDEAREVADGHQADLGNTWYWHGGVQESDILTVNVRLYEWDPSGDDYNWNDDIFKVNIGKLLTVNDFTQMSGSGLAFTETDATTKVTRQADNHNFLIYEQTKSDDATVRIKIQLEWWIE